MKRALKMSAVSLVLGIIFAAAGGIMVSRAGVKVSDVYHIVEENIQLGNTNVEFEKAEPINITELQDLTLSSSVSYQLNEFNTIEVAAGHCGLEFRPTDEDEMRIELDFPEKLKNKVFLQTAVRGGTLCVQNSLTEELAGTGGIKVTVFVPDNYKGGFTIITDGCSVEMCALESSMNMKLNLCNSTVEAEKLTAGEIVFEMSGTTFKAGEIHSRGEVSVSGISSTFEAGFAEAVSSKLRVSSSTVSAERIVGGLSCEAWTSSVNLGFVSVTGNISVTAEKGNINIRIPHDCPAALRREESYSSFKDNIKWTDNGQKNQNYRYFIETNVKFSIVTLEEIE